MKEKQKPQKPKNGVYHTVMNGVFSVVDPKKPDSARMV